ncbi:unnamed protein product, partial [Rotaria magnacalcarata]
MLVLPTNFINALDTAFNIEQYLDPKPNLGYRFERKIAEMMLEKKITADQEKNIRTRSQNFLICLFKELKQRLPENLNILKNVQCFSVGNTLRHIKEPIIPLLQSMHLNEEEIASIEIQYNSIHLLQWKNTTNTEAFWAEVFDFKDASGGNPFKEISAFALNLLILVILPNSNAE